MKSDTIPKTIQKWADAHSDMIDELSMSCDEFGEENEGPYSVWCYLKRGYQCSIMGTHIIHEPTVKDFMDATKYIDPCECEECV